MSENMQVCPSCGELVPIEYVICVWCGFDLTAEHIRKSGIQIGKKEAVNRMKRLLTNPMKTSKEISLIPDLTGGKLLLFGIAFMMTLSMLTSFSKLSNLGYNEPTSAISQPISLLTLTFTITLSYKFLVGLVFLIAQPLVLYLIFSIVWRISTRPIEYLAKSFGGRISREKTKAIIGYSMLPVFLGWFLNYFTVLFSSKVVVSTLDYQGIENALITVTRHSFGVVGYVLIIAGWIYSAVLGIIMMSRAAKLSIIESIIVIGLPYGIFMLIVF